MADGQGNSSRKNTGTVPKIKYSNNAAANHSTRDQSRGPRMSNNLTPSWYVSAESTNFFQNKRRNQRNPYLPMDVAVETSEIPNGIGNYSANGITPGSSSSTSRRNSVGSSTLKCDNVTKYPDRKQIEDKLTQIREYLEVTSSLMTSIRNSDEQIFDLDEKTNLLQMRSDLLDSEKKLVNLLEEIDNNQIADASSSQALGNLDNSSEHSGDYIRRAESDINSYDNELSILREQQLSLVALQQKSENRLADARRAQERMVLPHCSNQVNLVPQKSNKNIQLSEFDTAIKDLEERAKRLNRNKPPGEKFSPDKLMSEMQNLQSQIVSMHEANNEREQLIQVLDNRDTELRSQQAELKKKLFELQHKKEQVDQLVMQLQTMDEDENPSDVGMQVKNIVTMKDQLTKLKDMLEIVNNTADTASSADVQAAANEICLTAENLQNQIAKPSHSRNDSFVENRLDNHVSNETYQKESNKTQRNQGPRPKQRTSSINEKLALQSELEAKKRELEEIMGKHKAATSNLNHDVRGNPVNDMSWKPPIFCQDQGSEDRLSSDGDENEYSEVQESQNILFPQQVNSLYGSNRSNRGMDSRSECDLPTERLQNLTHTPDRNLRGLSVNSGEFVRQQPRATNNQTQEKLQKQLELIKSVCDSVLEQIPNNQQSSNNQPPSNIQQVRNNITPSSVFSDQHRPSCPPSPFRPNQHQINVFNPNNEMPWFGHNNIQNNAQSGSQNEANGYQSWFATNSLQTQSFMLNTLNQCCQMLWLQQRELAAVRNTVNMLQERLDMQQQQPYTTPPNLPSNPQPPVYSQPAQNQIPNNQLRPPTAPKTNQVSAACSMPNLNQYNPVASTSDLAFVNSSTVPNSGLLESCLNNASHLNATPVVDHANNMLHAVNSNLNTIPAQIWNGGPALNNQVAPGNRANNYWDNFRSYSRQNQLSSKNSESSFQNVVASGSGIERFNCERVNPFPLIAPSKSNSDHSSTNSRENTPRKRGFNGLRQNIENVTVAADHHAPPPDVLNVNQTLPKTSFEESHQSLPMPTEPAPEQHPNIEELEMDLHRLLNINMHRNNPTITDAMEVRPSTSREQPHERRNDWSDEQQENPRPKQNKLVDELRENVYKEVASLISANEARPHFLIQLFKDLQKIESDSLRLKILQSIQNILTQSIHYQQATTSRQLTESESINLSESSEQAWSRPTKQFASDILNMRLEGDEPFLQNSYKEIVSLLEASEDEVIGTHLLVDIKQVFLESDLFEDSVKDTVFLKHFSNVLDDVLEQYRGKQVHDVKIHLIQTIGDLLQGELSFIHLIQETIPESCLVQERKDSGHSNAAYNVASALFDLPNQVLGPLQNNDNIQNGDLAEADQSRLGESELEDEGVGGGLLESLDEESQALSQGQSEEVLNLPSIDFPTNGEGLDQVPTRLATKVKSESTTPTKDLLNSHHDQEPY